MLFPVYPKISQPGLDENKHSRSLTNTLEFPQALHRLKESTLRANSSAGHIIALQREGHPQTGG
jgi:hypothetical protein